MVQVGVVAPGTALVGSSRSMAVDAHGVAVRPMNLAEAVTCSSSFQHEFLSRRFAAMNAIAFTPAGHFDFVPVAVRQSRTTHGSALIQSELIAPSANRSVACCRATSGWV